MKVENVEIMGLETSVIASGYPMRTELKTIVPSGKDLKRCKGLSKLGNAHEQFLTGIRVNFDLTCTNKMWVEAERYRFLEFVSSQSTMHKISKMDIANQCNHFVDGKIINIVNIIKGEYIANPTKENYLKLLYNIPSGFELTARMTTNYRCLKNIYWQRKDHPLPEWREFCKWIETLPYAKELILMEE